MREKITTTVGEIANNFASLGNSRARSVSNNHAGNPPALTEVQIMQGMFPVRQPKFNPNGTSYHYPLVAPRPTYDAPGCIIKGEPEFVTLSDQRASLEKRSVNHE